MIPSNIQHPVSPLTSSKTKTEGPTQRMAETYLIEITNPRPALIQPNSVASALPKLLPIASSQKRDSHSVRLDLLGSSFTYILLSTRSLLNSVSRTRGSCSLVQGFDEVDTSNDISPLIGPSYLYRTSLIGMEVMEIISLEKLI